MTEAQEFINFVNAQIGQRNPLAVSPCDINALHYKELRKLDASFTARIDLSRVHELREKTLNAMTPPQIENLSPQFIAALSPRQVFDLPTPFFCMLKKEQIGALTKTQMGSILGSQLDALTPEQLGWLTKRQVHALAQTSLRFLTKETVSALFNKFSLLQFWRLSAHQVQPQTSPSYTAIMKRAALHVALKAKHALLLNP